MENYSTKDVAKLTDIADSTVRKYAQLLEKNGYLFDRNINGNRIFNENDVNVFLELKNVSKGEKSIEDSAHIVATKHIPKPATSTSDIADDIQVPQGSERAMLLDLMKKVDVLTDINKQLISRLDQQQKYIDERLEQRDKMLLESLKQSQEERKAFLQIAAAQEEEKNKGFFARLFGGK